MKRFLKNPWVIGIGSPLIVALIGQTIDWIFNTTILQTIWGNIMIAFTWFFALKLKVWIVLLIVVMVFWLSIVFWESRTNPKNPPKTIPDHYRPRWVDEYTSDIFAEIRWRWQWNFNYNTRLYMVENFSPFCPVCDCALISAVVHPLSRLKCPKCKRYYDPKEDDQEANRSALLWHTIKEQYTSDKSGS